MDTFFALAQGTFRSQVLYTICKLNVSEQLKDGPLTDTEIAEKIKKIEKIEIKEDLFSRLLRAAAAIGIFERDAKSLKYSLNDVSTLLTGPGSLRYLSLHWNEPPMTHAWSNISKTIEDGSNSFVTAHNQPIFEYYQKNAQSGERFNKAMTCISLKWDIGKCLDEKYKFDNVKTIVDVGGGQGSLAVQLLRFHPHLNGIVFDLQSVIESTKKDVIASYKDVESRLKFESGDFFQNVPAGDLYLLKMIIHDWNDEDSVKILKNVAKALNPNGKILIIDNVIQDVGDVWGSLLDLHMLAALGAKERSEKEFTALFHEAGLKVSRIFHIPPSPYGVLEVVKA